MKWSWFAVLVIWTLAHAAAAAQTPVSDAALDEGRRLFLDGSYEAARAAWQPLADAGDPRALYNLSTLYRKGLGVPLDAEKADSLLRAAADKDFNDARYVLADRLFSASGADEAKRQEAARLWLDAARQGHGLSAYRLGLLYWNGEAVARDLVRGRAWMSRASAHGVEEAQDALLTMDRYLDDAQRSESALLAAVLEDGSDSAPGPEPVANSIPAAQDPVATAAPPGPAEKSVPNGPVSVTDAAFHASWRLQVIALRTEKEALAYWGKLLKDAPDIIKGLDRRVVSSHIPERGTFHRLQIGPFVDRDAANARCQALKAAGHGCFAVAPDK